MILNDQSATIVIPQAGLRSRETCPCHLTCKTANMKQNGSHIQVERQQHAVSVSSPYVIKVRSRKFFILWGWGHDVFHWCTYCFSFYGALCSLEMRESNYWCQNKLRIQNTIACRKRSWFDKPGEQKSGQWAQIGTRIKFLILLPLTRVSFSSCFL